MIEKHDPKNIDKNELTNFLHHSLGEFKDPKDDIVEALDYAQNKGGFIYTLREASELLGAVVVLKTHMSGFVPENFLVYIAIKPDQRGKGLGQKLLKFVQEDLAGKISLHVEHDNPAKRLYERVGFTNKYTEMRWEPNGNS